MDFLNEFNKNTSKLEGVSTSAPGPSFWISCGNFVVNKIVSGMYRGGIAQGRLAMLTGPSGAGKSYLTGNIIKSAQLMGCGILVVDSENALDDVYMGAIGVDVESDTYVYRGVSTIAQSISVVSKFLHSYRKHGMTDKFLIVVDSLDALLTASAMEAYDDGIGKGEQGQHVQQLKRMLSPFMHDIKDLNVAILCTKQVYKSQDPIEAKNPITEYKMSEALKYPFSQILQISKLLLKNDTTKKYDGIRLRAFGQKTRFTKPFQQAIIEVPYDTGMDPYNGLLDVAEVLGVVGRSGSWYTYGDSKFQKGNFALHQEQILEDLIKIETQVINVEVPDDEKDEESESTPVEKMVEDSKRAKAKATK